MILRSKRLGSLMMGLGLVYVGCSADEPLPHEEAPGAGSPDGSAGDVIGNDLVDGGRDDAGDPLPRPISPALPPDPSVVTILDSLGDNSSALLPPLKTHGEWNDVTKGHDMQVRGPEGRDYSNKAVWMPDRKRAFFCGANHGAPHRLNDAWEFDLPSHTWVMLFAPDPHNAKGVMEIREGVVQGADGGAPETVKYVQTKRGGPTHYGHTWWGLTYDSNMRAALWMNSAIGGGPAAYMQSQLGEDPAIYRGPPLWAFYPEEKRWAPVLTPKPWPAGGYGGAMEFIPDLNGAFWYMAEWTGSAMSLYEPTKNVWRPLRPNNGANLYHSGDKAPRAESVMCYDRTRKVVVAQSGDRSTYHYDVKTNMWDRVLMPGASSDKAPKGDDSITQMYFDPTSGACLLYDLKKTDGIWSYMSETKTWTRHVPNGPKVPNTTGKVISYFDEAQNVFVVNVSDKTWVYRLRNVQ